MFSKSQASATMSANLCNLIDTAKTNNLNEYDYLKRILTDLPNAKTVNDVEALLPRSCKDVAG
ncbi:Uncharacterised protein [BD1-7 clade bacterium]|uniref:Transposase IS66 C-terminal domain-containing protein n=1 Tax=BD1-7 clade bacterium TaxID=2029982 RepID=A0A5S9P822_9GAMM|nr:Uncharacterised protein [BD1-7 clade bacterium]CAA0099638.1 Uncharacterised protein [BD1-7 clade bacterium]